MAEVQQIRCSACGTTNRVPQEKLRAGLQAICGRCKRPLFTKPAVVTDATFLEEVEHAPVPVLLDLWAPWCGPCGTLAPVIEELARDLAGRVKVVKLNVDENPGTAARFGVQSIPTLLVLEHGKELERIVGAQPKAVIAERLERSLG